MKKVIIWIIINGLTATLAIAGIWFELVWAGNLFKAVLWYFVVLYLIAALAKGANTPTWRKHGAVSSVPEWVSISYDVAMTALLVACGWFFYAFLNILQAYLCHYLTTPTE